MQNAIHTLQTLFTGNGIVYSVKIAMGNCSASKDTCFKLGCSQILWNPEQTDANAMLSLAQSPDGLDLELLVASCGYLISELHRVDGWDWIQHDSTSLSHPFTMFQLLSNLLMRNGRWPPACPHVPLHQ